MKRKCKNVDITDLDLIKDCIHRCLKKKKKTRTDIVRLFDTYGDIDNIALVLQKELMCKQLDLVPIWYRTIYDVGSQKARVIGIQDIKQQIYDYIAVAGLSELIAGLGKYQCASLPDRGQIYGALAIHRWISEKHNGKYRINYVCKFDIRKYYESIPQDKIIAWLEKRVKNEHLMWLIKTLIRTFKKGLSIGSYLSQYLGNLFLMDVYHKIQERSYRVRHKKNGTIQRVNLIYKTLFYMDDLFIAGSNSKDMMRAAEILEEEMRTKGLDLKDSWRCFKIGDDDFVDMMGFKIYRDHITIRRKTFRHIRRAVTKFRRNPNSVTNAKTLLSYKGLLEHSDSQKFLKSNNLFALFKKARKVVSKYDKTKILQENAKCADVYV